jgi:hypothetical protein
MPQAVLPSRLRDLLASIFSVRLRPTLLLCRSIHFSNPKPRWQTPVPTTTPPPVTPSHPPHASSPLPRPLCHQFIATPPPTSPELAHGATAPGRQRTGGCYYSRYKRWSSQGCSVGAARSRRASTWIGVLAWRWPSASMRR